MYISIIIALAMVITIAIPVSTVLATAQAPEGKNRDIESGFYNEDGYVPSKENRPAINPDFNPVMIIEVVRLRAEPIRSR